MGENLSIQSPDFERIKAEAGQATYEGVKLLWTALNAEFALRRREVRSAQNVIAPKVLSDDPGATQNNYNLGGAGVLVLTGSTNRTFTGIIAPSGTDSQLLVIQVVGSATYTFSNNSGSSDAENRIRSFSGADITASQDETLILLYVSGLWREVRLA